MKKDFVSRGRSVSDLKAHLVLTTKYRRKVLTTPMIDRLHLVNSLKSVSSRKLRQEFLPELEKTYYQKKVVWNSSYFLASCGGVTISTLKKYIENQDKPIN